MTEMNRFTSILFIFALSSLAFESSISNGPKNTSADYVESEERIQIIEESDKNSSINMNLGSAEVVAEDVYNIPATEYADNQMYIDDHPEIVQSHEFKFTYYCGCKKCCGKYSSGSESEAYGCKGDKLFPYHSVATDPDIISYGTELWDDEGNHYIAADTGSGVDGYHIDLFVGNHKEAIKLGVQYKTLYWVEEG
jgi:3D (Asp-Asp-Asp) domain-containing protein